MAVTTPVCVRERERELVRMWTVTGFIVVFFGGYSKL